MFKEINGNVWDILDENSTLYILTNDTITVIYNSETLEEKVFNPMSGGIALEAAIRNRNLPIIMAECIRNNSYYLGKDLFSGAELMRFPTMHNIGEYADLLLVKSNLYRVKEYCLSNPERKVYLPRPGCGIGDLDWEDEVKPLCEEIFKDIDTIYIASK